MRKITVTEKNSFGKIFGNVIYLEFDQKIFQRFKLMEFKKLFEI